MKRIVVMFVSLLCLGSMEAENYDMIITIDREQIQGIVKEISEEKISYSRPDRPSTVVYTLPRSKVVLIQFADGSIELFQDKPAASKAEVVAEQITDTVKEEVASLHMVTEHQPSSSVDSVNHALSSRIFRDGREYMHNNTYISAKQVGIILKNNDAVAYTHWKKADNLALSGAVIAGVGLGSILGGLGTIPLGVPVCLGLTATGLVLTGVGTTLILCAPIHYEKALDIYNEKYDRYTTLSFSASPQSLSFSVCF